MSELSEAISKFKDTHRDKPDINHVVDFLVSEYSDKKSINFSYEQAVAKADSWLINVTKKAQDSSKQAGLVEVIKEFDKGIKFVRLIDFESFNWESSNMGHCVSSSYMGHDGIYSLRDINDIPKCTIRIEYCHYSKESFIEEISGKGNGKVSIKYVDYIMEIIKDFNYSIYEGELNKIGYISSYDEEWIKENFNSYKIIELKGKKFLYTGKDLSLKGKLKDYSMDRLNFCIKYGFNKAAKYMIRKGINVQKKSLVAFSQGWGSDRIISPFGLIIIQGNFELLKECIVYSHITEEMAMTGCRMIIRYSNQDDKSGQKIIKYLLDRYQHFKSNRDLFKAAIENDNFVLINNFLENGVDIHTNNDELVFLAKENSPKVFKYLIKHNKSKYIKSLAKYGLTFKVSHVLTLSLVLLLTNMIYFID